MVKNCSKLCDVIWSTTTYTSSFQPRFRELFIGFLENGWIHCTGLYQSKKKYSCQIMSILQRFIYRETKNWEKSISRLSCNLAKCCRGCSKSSFLLRQHIAWNFEKFCFSFLFNWNILVSIFSGTLGKKTFPHNIPKPIFSPITFSLTPIPISAKCGRLAEFPYWTENIRSKKHCLGSPVAFLQLQNYSQIQISYTTRKLGDFNLAMVVWL